MSGIVHDMSNWPLLVVRFTSTCTDADIARFIEEQRAMLARNERFVELADATDARVLNAAQRRMCADWLKESADASKRLCIGLSTVIASPLVRGAMQAVLWMVTPPMPVKMGASLAESAKHCREWLRDSDLPGHERAERYLLTLERRAG